VIKNSTEMTKRILLFCGILALLIASFCLFIINKKSPDTPQKTKVVTRDLTDIQKEGTLKVVTSYSSTSYFLYKGQPMGYEYDLLKRFAKHLNVKLDIHISNNLDTMFYLLNSGKVDLIAHGLTITKERKRIVHFSDYLYLTHQVLVQRKPKNWRKKSWSKIQASLIHDAIELIDDTVSVRNNTAYITRLKNLGEETGGTIYIDTIYDDLSTERIIEMVANGQIKYTVADNNIAHINASYYPQLDVSVPVSFSQRLAWAVRKQSPEFEQTLNEWIKTMKSGVAYYAIYNKYFRNKQGFRRRGNSEYFSLNGNNISQYDALIQAGADSLRWDWRFLAAMVYQESKFNPGLESVKGAKGLMQLMPRTAQHYGVRDINNPEQNITAAVKMLSALWKRFEDIPDSIQRIKFTIASYNCGYGHIIDARNMARKDSMDANIWDNNVAEAILKLSYPVNYKQSFIKYGYVRGVEPFSYVKEIFDRYENYVQFVKEKPREASWQSQLAEKK